jgi:hypothetical protein
VPIFIGRGAPIGIERFGDRQDAPQLRQNVGERSGWRIGTPILSAKGSAWNKRPQLLGGCADLWERG